jgi:hypothetical protein
VASFIQSIKPRFRYSIEGPSDEILHMHPKKKKKEEEEERSLNLSRLLEMFNVYVYRN